MSAQSEFSSLVIGDTGILGTALVTLLLRAGWNVSGASRGLTIPAPGSARIHGACDHYEVDVMNVSALEVLVGQFLENHVEFDLLALPIGSHCCPEDFMSAKPVDPRRSVEEALVAPLLALASVLPVLRKGAMVLFYSGGGALRAPTTGWNVSYAAAKAGLHRAVEALALQLHDAHIWPVILDPGWVPDPKEALHFEGGVATVSGIAAKDIHPPEDAADAALFLFENRGAQIAGRAFSVNRDYRADMRALRAPTPSDDFLLLRMKL